MNKRDRHDPDEEDDIIVERSSLGILVGALALLVALIALLHYFGLLPI